MTVSYKNLIPGYRPDIDGLRAVAVLPVLLFHAGVSGFSGGYVGVDVFFVISGFLITRILLKDQHLGWRALPRFWERRARRILPALLFLLVVTSILASFLYLPIELKRFGQEVFSQAIFSSNVLFFLTSGGYFDPGAETRTLLHTWSLSVEEQFYVLYPLLFVAFIKVKMHALVRAVLLITVASLVISIWTANDYKIANFYLLPSRAWELGLGCLLALHPSLRVPEKFIEPVAALGLAMILYAVVAFNDKTVFPGAAALIPCIGTALLLLTGQNSQWVGKLLRTNTLVGVGKISYSLYLWHWPLLVILSTVMIETPSMTQKLGVLVLSFLMAWISWKWVELPFRQKKLLATRKTVFAGALTGLILVGACGLVFHLTTGLPARWDAGVLRLANGEQDRNPRRGECRNLSAEQVRGGQLCFLGTKAPLDENNVLVWGDSHADAMLPVFDELAIEFKLAGWQAARDGCPPLIPKQIYLNPDCVEFNKAVLDWIRANDVTNVVLIARWAAYVRDPEEFSSDLSSFVKNLSESGIQTWIVRQTPEQPFAVPSKLARAKARGLNIHELGSSRNELEDSRQAEMRIIGASFEMMAGVLDPYKVLCNARDRCEVVRDGMALFADDDHLSTFGALQLKKYMELFFTKQLSSNDEGSADCDLLEAQFL